MLQSTDQRQAPPTHLLGVLRTLWQWRKQIVFTTLAGMVLAIVISLLLPEYYTGHTSFVAISPEQSSIEGTFGSGSNRIQFYGTGDDIDRLLSIAESDEVIDFMVDSFDLYSVYGIDSTRRKSPVYVRQEFMSLYSVERTPRDIIELEIEDQDPVRAAVMADAARRKIDAVNLGLVMATNRRNAETLRREVKERDRNLEELNERLAVIRRESGVYDPDIQSETLSVAASTVEQELVDTEARLGAFRQRSSKSARDSISKLSVALVGLESKKYSLDSQLQMLNQSIGLIENMEEERIQANEVLGYTRIRMKQYETILNSDRRSLEVIEQAKVPVVKTRPVRSLIVVGATVLSFLFAVVGVLLIENGKRYDWGSITR